MSFVYTSAVREKQAAKICVAGPPGSGKTFSALRLATGLADGGGVFVLDTEARRSTHYAEDFKFQMAPFEPPYTYERCLEGIAAAKAAGATVCVIDSASDLHEGLGGYLAQHDAEVERMAGSDYRKREQVKQAGWIKPSAAFKRFRQEFVRLDIHVVFCFRANDKTSSLQKVSGKWMTVDEGWVPVMTKDLVYWADALLVLPPGSRGVPDVHMKTGKMMGAHEQIFRQGRQIDEAMGREYAAWCNAGTAPAVAPPQDTPPLAEPAPNGIQYRIGDRTFPSVMEWHPTTKSALMKSDDDKVRRFWDGHKDLLNAMMAGDASDATAALDIKNVITSRIGQVE